MRRFGTAWRLQGQARRQHLIRELPGTVGVERALQELPDFSRFGVELAGQDADVIAVPQLGFQAVNLTGPDRLDRGLPQVLMGNQGRRIRGIDDLFRRMCADVRERASRDRPAKFGAPSIFGLQLTTLCCVPLCASRECRGCWCVVPIARNCATSGWV